MERGQSSRAGGGFQGERLDQTISEPMGNLREMRTESHGFGLLSSYCLSPLKH